MKRYEIVNEPITLKDGSNKDKWNIYYYDNDVVVGKEFYSLDGVTPVDGYKIREEFKENEKIAASKIDISSIIVEIQKTHVLTPKSK